MSNLDPKQPLWLLYVCKGLESEHPIEGDQPCLGRTIDETTARTPEQACLFCTREETLGLSHRLVFVGGDLV